jgi:hypothetical protein
MKVIGDFYCGSNELETLEYSPENVVNFSCNNNKLKTLIGMPKIISNNFDCSNNDLISMEGFTSANNFICIGCPIYNIYKLFEDPTKIELFNDYDCVRVENGKPCIIIDRLNDFLEEIGKPSVENVEVYKSI